MAIVDFIMSNYIAILIVVIIIIFALIGRYVEKVGFFETAETTKKNAKSNTESPVEKTEEKKEKVKEKPASTSNKEISMEDIDSALFAPLVEDKKYDELNNEVKGLLSKKEVIDDDLLSDINNLSLDKTQKYNFGDIPDLDDVDLPKIKKADSDEDVWKF